MCDRLDTNETRENSSLLVASSSTGMSRSTISCVFTVRPRSHKLARRSQFWACENLLAVSPFPAGADAFSQASRRVIQHFVYTLDTKLRNHHRMMVFAWAFAVDMAQCRRVED
jgi:hypothetical protein